MLLASGLTVAFLIAGLSAYRWLRGDRAPAVARALKAGVITAAALIPLQIFAGDMHGLNTLKHQPAKVAAMEANWETRGAVPLILFAIPDQEARTNRYALQIPYGASLILEHSLDGVVPGLNDYIDRHPPVAAVFYSFRVMVGLGVLMLLVSWVAAFFLWRRGVEGLPRPVVMALVGMTFSGWVATLAGWYVTEIGRQPWLVTGVLTTAEAASTVPAGMILSTLLLYLLTYVLLLAAYVAVLFHLARKGAGPKDERGMFPPVMAPGIAPGTAAGVQAAE
jgi:cytochrome d ubiquinol oxidase subunit I